MAALAPPGQFSPVRPGQRQQGPIRAEQSRGAGAAAPSRYATFGLGAEAQEPVVGDELEERAHAEGVPAHAHLPLGRVQQDEGEDAVQEGRHLLGAEAVVEVEQDLPVHLGLVLKAKLLPQLQEPTRRWRQVDVPPSVPPPRPALTFRWL